jgi:hypothetical protein
MICNIVSSSVPVINNIKRFTPPHNIAIGDSYHPRSKFKRWAYFSFKIEDYICFDIFRVQNMGHSLTTFTISDGKKLQLCPINITDKQQIRSPPFSILLDVTMGSSWSWSYVSWIYNYLCNQCLSPLTL